MEEEKRSDDNKDLVVQTLELIQERIKSHDVNRIRFQGDLRKKVELGERAINEMRDKLQTQIDAEAKKAAEKYLHLIESGNKIITAEENCSDIRSYITDAAEAAQSKVSFTVTLSPNWKVKDTLAKAVSLAVTSSPRASSACAGDILKMKPEGAVAAVREELIKAENEQNESRIAAMEEVNAKCDELLAKLRRLGDGTNSALETEYKREDSRLQKKVSLVRECCTGGSSDKVLRACRESRATLVISQSYSLLTNSKASTVEDMYSLKISCAVQAEKKPHNLRVTRIDESTIFFEYELFNEDEEKSIADFGILDKDIEIKAEVREKSATKGAELLVNKTTKSVSMAFLMSGEQYLVRMRLRYNGKMGEWSEEVEFTAPEFAEACVWKPCPTKVSPDCTYFILGGGKRVASKNSANGFAVIIGSVALPKRGTTSWGIKCLKTFQDKSHEVYVGVRSVRLSPCDNINFENHGWFFNCYNSSLWSGPPHKYKRKYYGPIKELGEYVRTGDTVGVVMDTEKGSLSFSVNGESYGVAFEGIPLDKPLVPCVVLKNECDTIELVP